MESDKRNDVLRKTVSQRACFIMDQVKVENNSSKVPDQLSTSRCCPVGYVEDSDDSYKDLNYCPSSDASDDKEEFLDENCAIEPESEEQEVQVAQ
ncbi:unnamed protein product [Acanthoscelides obtectus]|uniref:Uncharacterized protein n=1 Tax=Acanthoscelides obtectus TaxID=200917 RepID=A0A9P0PE25_ACAOB|nr:unnamed protein product [Acanthoscelides obtectus]CAK1641776.1 hypothetical protein AOBTE_LOCUS12625 [Acanthoscelides obtectus]